MSGDIMPFDARPSREMQRADQRVIEEVRLAARRAEGALALGGHIMSRAVELDEHRRQLAGRGGPELNKILVEIEVNALHTAGQIQRGLFDNWRL